MLSHGESVLSNYFHVNNKLDEDLEKKTLEYD